MRSIIESVYSSIVDTSAKGQPARLRRIQIPPYPQRLCLWRS